MITDKHVLITGGGTGIGRAIAEYLQKKVKVILQSDLKYFKVAMTSTNISALKWMFLTRRSLRYRC